jgi:hypothetical protein
MHSTIKKSITNGPDIHGMCSQLFLLGRFGIDIEILAQMAEVHIE